MSYIDDLVKIKELLDSGVLSQEEYDAQKQKILQLSYAEETVDSEVAEAEAIVDEEVKEAEETEEAIAEAEAIVDAEVKEAEETVAAYAANDSDASVVNEPVSPAINVKESYEANKPNYQEPAYQAPPQSQNYGQQQNNQQYYQQGQPNNQPYDSTYGQQPNGQQYQQSNQGYGQPQYNQQGNQGYGQPQYNQQGNQGYGQPYGQQPYAPGTNPIVQKSRVAAGILGIFLGCFGVHNFYLGFTTKAIIQLLLTVLLWWAMGLGIIIASIWGLIEGIMILVGNIPTDANGVPLKD